MFQDIKLVLNEVGTYDAYVYFNSAQDVEFSFDMFSPQKLVEKAGSISGYVKKNYKDFSVRAVKVVVSGVIVATIPLMSIMSVSAADKYSMAYLYAGSPSQQISYINRTGSALNTVSPSYFDINSDGSLKVNTVSTELVNHAHSKGMKVIPFLSNHWDRQGGIAALQDTEKLAQQIADNIEKYNLDGVNVDIENVTDVQKDQYTDLVTKLREKIPAHKEVSVAVAANPKGWTAGWHGSYDYTNLAKNSDYLMIMAYDEHWQGSEPGPVASISFVENSIKYALSKTSGDKIVLGMPFFGRIWSADNTFNGNGVTLEMVNKLISDYNAKVTYDYTQQSPKAEFTVKTDSPANSINGKKLTPGTYTVWFENEQSFQAKMAMINKYDLKGAGAWALGQEPSAIWSNYSSWLNTGTSLPTPPQNPVPDQTTPPPTTTPPPATTPAAPVVKTGVVTGDGVNMRSSANTSAKVITKVKKNTKVTVLETLKGWYKIQLPTGQTGYMSSNYVKLTATGTTSGTTTTTPIKRGTVTATTLNVRATASTNSRLMATLKKNAKVSIISTSKGWHKIDMGNGRVGYVSAKYVK